MMTDEQFTEWCRRNHIPPETEKVLSKIRKGVPARKIRPSIKNNTIDYRSFKMKFTIQAESRWVEYPHIVSLEIDDDVLEYYDQPIRIYIEYISNGKKATGKPTKHKYTFDFLAIHRTYFEFVECKKSGEMVKLIKRWPTRYSVDENGVYHFIQGDKYANELGGRCRVWTSDEINWMAFRNILFLQQFYRPDYPMVPKYNSDQIRDIVSSNPGISLSELFIKVASFSKNYTYKLIADQGIYIDLEDKPISEPALVRVFIDKATALSYSILNSSKELLSPDILDTVEKRVGTSIKWGDQDCTIVSSEYEKIQILIDKTGELKPFQQSAFDEMVRTGIIKGLRFKKSTPPEILDILRYASPADKENGLRIWKIVEPILRGEPYPKNSEYSRKQLKRYVVKATEFEKTYGVGYGYYACITNTSQRGNRVLNEEDQLLKDDAIEDLKTNYEKEKRPTIYAAWNTYASEREKTGRRHVCYKTYAKYNKTRSRTEQTLARDGYKAANVQETPYREEHKTVMPPHGDRIFGTLHIDHTHSIELVCPYTGRNLGTAYETFITDPKVRRIYIVYVSFTPPNQYTDVFVFRLLAQKYGYFPTFVVTDGGPDFSGGFFEKFLSRHGVHKLDRRKSNPHDGTVHENIFGITEVQFRDELLGNTLPYLEMRQITPDTNPKGNAVWPLGRYYNRLCQYSFIHYDNRPQPGLLNLSPRAAYNFEFSKTEIPETQKVIYDDAFIFDSLPTTPKGTAIIQPSDGVKINYFYYWTDAFNNPEVEKTSVPVKFDFFDISKAHAYVKGINGFRSWEPCISTRYAQLFAGFSYSEIKILSDEYAQRNRIAGKKFSITEHGLAEFWLSLKEEEKELINLRLKNLSNNDVLSIIRGGNRYGDNQFPNFDPSTPPPAPPSTNPQNTPKDVTKKSDRKIPDYGEF